MTGYKKIAVVANGDLTDNLIKKAARADFIISADAASLVFIKKGIIPDLAVGDFDSTHRNKAVFYRTW